MLASIYAETSPPLLGAKIIVEAGPMVMSPVAASDEGTMSFKSGRKPAFGTLSLRSASAMSQAVYFLRDWSWSVVGPEVAMVRLGEDGVRTRLASIGNGPRIKTDGREVRLFSWQ